MIEPIIGIIIAIIGILITILGILISFCIHRKNRKLILTEKQMISDKVADIKTTLQSHIHELEADRERRPREKFDTVGIREEKIQAMIEILSRFEERLKNTKIK
jgi:uncharacterized membrane protein